MENKTPIILCCGANGRAVVFGWADSFPEAGKPVELVRARMVLYWSSDTGGLFGLAKNGPAAGSRVTAPVDKLIETNWQEAILVSEEAAAKIDGWAA